MICLTFLGLCLSTHIKLSDWLSVLTGCLSASVSDWANNLDAVVGGAKAEAEESLIWVNKDSFLGEEADGTCESFVSFSERNA